MCSFILAFYNTWSVGNKMLQYIFYFKPGRLCVSLSNESMFLILVAYITHLFFLPAQMKGGHVVCFQ